MKSIVIPRKVSSVSIETNIKLKRAMLGSIGSQFFTVKFIDRHGAERTFNARKGVIKEQDIGTIASAENGGSAPVLRCYTPARKIDGEWRKGRWVAFHLCRLTELRFAGEIHTFASWGA